MKNHIYLLLTLLISVTLTLNAQERPNIVLIFPDNLGIGEVGAYGGARGVPTPNIDRIGEEGIRFTNFNVEYSCTVSRIALLTGRYAPRTGEGYAAGMTLWEVTMAEALKSVGYSTALYGKWHVGGSNWEGRREPTHQGFDEWYGIPLSSHTAQYTSMEGFDPERNKQPYIWEGKAGEPSKKVKPYNLETRRTIDREAAEKSIAFMEDNVKNNKPFFLYYPMTQIHFPTLPHPDKAGTTGTGDIGDSMADVDHNVGMILEALERLDIEDNTLVIWCTDNGAEMRRPWRGSAGPWRGYYNTAMEGGIRTPFVMRWPGKIKPGQVSNEVVHEVDLLPTLVAAAGASHVVPKDRYIDGVNQIPFVTGEDEHSARESVLFVAREGHVMAVKWHDWKMWYHFTTEMPDPQPENLVRLYDLGVDPREEIDVKDFYPWVISVMDGIVQDYEKTLETYPRVPGGVDDPYVPPAPGTVRPAPAYERTDRKTLTPRPEAMPNPDFTGTWSTSVVSTAPPTGRGAPPPIHTLGSGWGDQISIVHSDDELMVERTYFKPREFQPLMRYHYGLDGLPSEIILNLGRTERPPVATSKWDGNRLVITTKYQFRNPLDGEWSSSETVQTIWLEPATRTPYESRLIVETTRGSAFGGPVSTNRTFYTRGYR